ncbi:MAG: hypothetical protein KBC91_06505, partial [Candidatus Omnitrophica bacterium]|nr:hypothetical protein [Candidatus Omnitrophota bacterium]
MPQNHVIRGFFKVIALMTAVCLAVPSSASAFSTPSESLPAISLQNSGTFQIPESLGTLDEFKLGRTGKTFVLIQDAHQSFEAQQHIADLIHLLVREHGVKTVFEEGYEGLVPTDDLMNDISDPLVKQRVAYYLMDQLLIGGAEYAHINRFDHVSRLSLPVTRKVAVPRQSLVAGEKKSDLPSVHDEKRATSDERLNFKLIGADKLREHFDSVAWYSKAARVQAQVDRDLSSANKELERLIPRFVSKPMRRLLKAKRAYEIQKIDFIAYLREIAGLAIEQTGGISFSVDYPGLANAVRALDSKQAQAIEEVRK